MQWSTNIPTYMAFGYYASLFLSQNKKIKTVIVTFLSHNSDLYWNCEFTSCNSDFIRIVRYCKFIIARKKSEFWDKVTITHCHLYSMAEISFHRFHMCKGKNKQTKMHSLTQILTPLLYLFSLFLINYSSIPSTTIPLPLPDIILFSLWFFVLFCIHKTNSKRSFLLYVVDVMERVSTPEYSSNWDWNQLFLNISVICYLKVLISCYNTLYRDHFSILLSWCWCRSRSCILYLRSGTLGLQFWHTVFKHL